MINVLKYSYYYTDGFRSFYKEDSSITLPGSISKYLDIILDREFKYKPIKEYFIFLRLLLVMDVMIEGNGWAKIK